MNESINSTYGVALSSVDQAEPNGVFASKNSEGTWVMCLSELPGQLDPIQVETKVTVYPYPVEVDFDSGRVTKSGTSSITLSSD